jgi:hypothetical protein
LGNPNRAGDLHPVDRDAAMTLRRHRWVVLKKTAVGADERHGQSERAVFKRLPDLQEDGGFQLHAGEPPHGSTTVLIDVLPACGRQVIAQALHEGPPVDLAELRLFWQWHLASFVREYSECFFDGR